MKNLTWKNVMGQRNAIFGFAAIWIVFYHIYNSYYFFYVPVITQVLRIGNMGVDIFVFLSAIGLSFSMEKNTTGEFYKNRFLRVGIPYLLIALPFYIWNALAVYGVSFKALGEFLLNLTTLSFWCRNGAPSWYIAFVVVIYALFPLLYKVKKRHKHMLVLLILLSIATELLLKYFNSPIYSFGERILSRIPVFLVGMIFADYVKEKRKISPLFMIIAIPVAITGYVLTGFYSDKLDIVAVRYIYGVMSVAFVALLGFVLDKIKNIKVSKPIFGILNFCGALSLEIYLIHTFIIRFFGHYGIFPKLHYRWYYIIIPILTVILSVLVGKITKLIVKRFKKA